MSNTSFPKYIAIIWIVLIVLVIVAFDYLKQQNVLGPKYNLVYALIPKTGDHDLDQYMHDYWEVAGGRVMVGEQGRRTNIAYIDDNLKEYWRYLDENAEKPELYIYDMESKETRSVSFEEIQKYVVQRPPRGDLFDNEYSPDGYRLEHYRYKGYIGYFDENARLGKNPECGWIISKGFILSFKKDNNLQGEKSCQDVEYLGWIKRS